MDAWKIEFFDPADGMVLGSVEFADGKLTPEPPIADLAEGYEPADFYDRYESWSNGYLSSRLVGNAEA